MKISFNKNDLAEATGIVMKAVSNKTTMPILGCILIDASDSGIKMTANDMEIAIETKVDGNVRENGKIAVEARLFSDIIRKLPEGEVVISGDKDKINIRSGKAHFDITGRSPEDFVSLPVFDTKDYICLSEFTLKELVRQTIFSIAPNDTNKIMTGELFEIKGDRLKVVSLDGHRISIRNIKLRESYEEKKIIVPGKTLAEISRIIPGDADKDVYIFFSNNYIIFEYGETIVLSRLIDGNYFNVDKMITSDYETKITLSRKDILDTIERAMLLVRESDKKPIIFNITEEGMEVSMNSVIGYMKEEVEVEKTGKDIMIGFNPRFLQDAFKAIDDDTVDIYMMNPKAPCFIRDAEDSYIYLILPVNF